MGNEVWVQGPEVPTTLSHVSMFVATPASCVSLFPVFEAELKVGPETHLLKEFWVFFLWLKEQF